LQLALRRHPLSGGGCSSFAGLVFRVGAVLDGHRLACAAEARAAHELRSRVLEDGTFETHVPEGFQNLGERITECVSKCAQKRVLACSLKKCVVFIGVFCLKHVL
jgi:hypothetical protein